MISDELAALGFALHHQRGQYALLIGSGVSKSAGVDTGFEVLQSFISKHAEVLGEDTRGDSEMWYSARYNEAATYSNVLTRFAPNEALRKAALDEYFRGKAPRDEHQMVRMLVEGGYVKLILTTNFDDLIEQALGAIPHVVLTFEDIEQVEGKVLLQHASVLVIKLHGDYRRGRLLNTSNELNEYGNHTQSLLRRILDEYGLIACGWSSEWDVALRDAIKATRQQLYWFYYCHYTPRQLDDTTKQMIDARSGRIIPIEGAKEFFRDLVNAVNVYNHSPARPFNREIARSETLRLLGSEQNDFELERLWQRELNRVLELINSEDFVRRAQYESHDDIDKQDWIIATADVMENLLEMTATLCWYGRGRNNYLIRDTVTFLAAYNPPHLGRTLRIIPVQLILWVVGTVAADRDVWDYFEAGIWKVKVPRRGGEKYEIRSVPLFLNNIDNRVINTPDAMATYEARMEVLKKYVLPLIGSTERLRYARDIYEFVLAIVTVTDAILSDLPEKDRYFVPTENMRDSYSWARLGNFVLDVYYDKQKRDPVGVFRLWWFREQFVYIPGAIQSMCEAYQHYPGGRRNYPNFHRTFETGTNVVRLED